MTHSHTLTRFMTCVVFFRSFTWTGNDWQIQISCLRRKFGASTLAQLQSFNFRQGIQPNILLLERYICHRLWSRNDLARDSVQNIPNESQLIPMNPNESRFCWVCLAKLVETSHIPHPTCRAVWSMPWVPWVNSSPFWCCMVLEIISQRSHQHLPIFPGRVRNLSTGSAARPSQRTPSFWIIIK